MCLISFFWWCLGQILNPIQITSWKQAQSGISWNVLVAEPFGFTSVFIVVKEKFISILKTSRPIFVCTTLQEKWFMINGFLNRVTLFINNQSDSTKIPFCCFMLCFILMTLTTRTFFFLFSIFGFRQRFSQQAYSKLW